MIAQQAVHKRVRARGPHRSGVPFEVKRDSIGQTFCEFTFEAAHQTPPFSTLHGHSFLVRVVLHGPSHPVYGWSHNLDEVEPVLEHLRQELDHRYLNDIDGLEVPTLENVARWIWRRLGSKLDGIESITVSRGTEGRREGAIYRGGDA